MTAIKRGDLNGFILNGLAFEEIITKNSQTSCTLPPPKPLSQTAPQDAR